MPQMYRSMKAQVNLLRPSIGDSCTKLGVRDPKDLKSRDGRAHPGEGGMSVVSSIAGFRHRVAKCLFSPEMLPKRLHDNGKIPGASGPNSLHVFCIGQGAFESAMLTEDLRLEPDEDEHGTVQPARIMPYDDYRRAIVDTCEQWRSGEEDQ